MTNKPAESRGSPSKAVLAKAPLSKARMGISPKHYRSNGYVAMKRMMSLFPACCQCLLLSVVLLGASCTSDVPDKDVGADTPSDSGALPPVRVQVAKAQRITLRPTLDLVGTITPIPERTAVISPQVGGWVQQLHVVEGESVQAGAPLVDLDPRLAQSALQRARAVVAEKSAVVRRLQSGYLPQEIAGARQDADKAAGGQ